MADHYLLKTEPSEYSSRICRVTRNRVGRRFDPTAVRIARDEARDEMIIYETGEPAHRDRNGDSCEGESTVQKKPEVTVKAGKGSRSRCHWMRIKANKLFADSPLVRIGRLSVVPLTSAQYKRLRANENASEVSPTGEAR